MIALRLDELAAIVGGALMPGGVDSAATAASTSARLPDAAPQRGTPNGSEVGSRHPSEVGALQVSAVAVDSRQLTPGALFVALRGGRTDGHAFLGQAATAGAVAALVEADRVQPGEAPLPIITVLSPLESLQRLAAWYRHTHLGRVVAITGSNGKTVVKDALSTALQGSFSTAASPGSFNSQLGVPLSVLAAPPGSEMCVFEAGISAPGEMAALRDILAPDFGILTNVGLAHIAAFTGREQLAREKLSLFANLGAASETGAKPVATEAGAKPVATTAEALRVAIEGGATPQKALPPAAEGGAMYPWPLRAGSPNTSSWLILPGQDEIVAAEAHDLWAAESATAAVSFRGAGGAVDRSADRPSVPRRPQPRLLFFPFHPTLPQLVEQQPDGGSGPAAGGGLHEILTIRFPAGERAALRVRTRSAEIVDDVMMAVGAAYLLGVPPAAIAVRLRDYAPPPTRLEAWRSPSGVTLVNDLVSADPLSVRAALRTASDLAATTAAALGRSGRKVFVFGGMRELGPETAREYAAVGGLAGEHRFDRLLAVGGAEQAATVEGYLAAFPAGNAETLADAAAVRRRLRELLAPGDTLLLKGPRHGGIDLAALDLMEAMAPNRLQVDLGAVAGNIASFRRHCGPRVRIMAMVKALAYGSDLVRMGSWFASAGVDHLGVSTADEGIALRRAGVTLPILVTLPTPDEAAKLVELSLVPAVFSFALLAPLAAAARAALPPGQRLPIHLKVDTGMHRVGVAPAQAVDLARQAAATGVLHVAGLMTHFASAEDPAADADTRLQIALFEEARAALAAAGFTALLCHAAATAAAVRFPASHYDMVRLGGGLYGIYTSPAVEIALPLQLAVTLLSRIAEVRTLAKGDRVGYGGTYTVIADRLRVGILPIGYHDGIPWSLGNRGAALVEGRPAGILGRVSMDSAVIDLSAAPTATAGTEALLFGSLHGHVLRPEAVAEQAGTIAYELLARLGPRIQRLYVGF